MGYSKEQSMDGPQPQLVRSSLLSQHCIAQSGQSQWVGVETKGARVPPHLYLLGVFMGIWKSEVSEKKVSLSASLWFFKPQGEARGMEAIFEGPISLRARLPDWGPKTPWVAHKSPPHRAACGLEGA